MTSPRGVLADLLRARRERVGLTQREVADEAGISLGALQDLEQGRTMRPRQQSLNRLASVLRLTVNQHEELVRTAATAARPGQQGGGQLGAGPARAGPTAAGRQGAAQARTGRDGPRRGGRSRHGGAGLGDPRHGDGDRRAEPEGSAARLQGTQHEPGTPGDGRGGARNGHAGNGGAGNGGSGLRVEVLGPLVVWRDGELAPLGPVRQRAVLGLLTLHAGTGLHRSAIIDALWGDDPPPTSAAMVQAQVSRVRRLLGPAAVPAGVPGGGARLSWDGSGYRLSLDGIGVDAAEFGELAGRARAAATAGDAAGACELFERALGLWRGQPLEDIDALRGHPAVAGLARQRDDLVIEYAGAAAGAGRYDGVAAHLAALTAREPLDERAHAHFIMTLAATGRQAAALRIYHDLVARLDNELGVRPGPELTAAHLQVLQQQIPPAVAGPAPASTPAAAALATVAADGRGLAAEAPVPRQLPGAVPRFIGRSAELAQLTSLLDQAADGGSTVVISAIGGTAGVGKTALAVHWAHLVAGRFPDGQLYVNLRGFGPSAAPMAPAEAVRVFLEGLGVAVERIPLGLGARAGLYRSLLAGRRMLIVADNARDPELVRPLLPGTPGCLVLVTSRNQLTGLAAADGAHLLTLDTLSEAEARELLENRLGQQRVAAEPGSVTELTGLCSRLPLALSIAAARAAARPELPLATLAAELRGTDARLDALGSRDAVTDVRTVFSWSCRQLTEPAARVFRLLGVHPGPDITVPAAASLAGLPRGQAEAALAELAGAHLVTEHVPDRYALHDLLRAYAAEQARDIDDDATRHAALQRVLDHYLHTAATASSQLNPFGEPVALGAPQPGVRPEQPAGREQAAEWFHAEQQVLLGAIARAASDGFSTHAWQLPWATATFFSWHGYWHELAATQESGLAAARQLGDLAAQAEIHRYLGRARAQLGDYTEAIVQLTALMELGQQLGSTITQARAHIDLGRVYDLQGRDSDAAPHAEQALRLYHAAGHRPGEAVALNAVGWSLTRLGRYQEAVDYIAQALAIHCELGDQFGEANTLDTLGYAYHLLGKPAEAIDCYERTLDLYGETGDRRSQAMTLTHLGDAHHAVGDGAAARRAWHRALDILDDLQHPDAGQLRSRLGLRPDGRGTGPGVAAANGATSDSWSQQPGR